MRGRVLAWVGGAVAVAAVAGVAVYLASVGLDKADKWASVGGLFIGLAGLSLTVNGVVRARRTPEPEPPRGPQPGSGAGDVRNEVRGTVHGPVIMGRDFRGDVHAEGSRPEDRPGA
ncbi:hypothetical protein GCM10023085_18700 [Actinomadura viridis]|uniref:Uncharacterized protein n=1 Tax=Actinomadura viridis TaxID=58110 RepID=A0A931GJ71_9ACTN|nr:hypothetical protein [Actinomadura viridis]MBG6089373.1 hypothetical protein [Actinomadura viridis]